VSIDPANKDAFEALMADVPFGNIGRVADAGGPLTIRGTTGAALASLPVSDLKGAWMAPLGDLI
jgi:hypothetical protein